MPNDYGHSRGRVADSLTVTASENTPYALPRGLIIHDIDILMSCFAVTDAATYTELDAMIGDITVRTSEGDESVLDATDLTVLLNYQQGYGQLVDATVADNDRQVFYWRDPLVTAAPKERVSPMEGLDGKFARTITLNHAADGAVDNRIVTIYANGVLRGRKSPKWYAVFKRIVASQTAVAGVDRQTDLPDTTRGGVFAKLARLVTFGTTQLPDAENASHTISTIRDIDFRINQNAKLETHFAIEQALNNAATDAGVDIVNIDNGSVILDYFRFNPDKKIEELLDITDNVDLSVLEGAANAYRLVAQELLAQIKTASDTQ